MELYLVQHAAARSEQEDPLRSLTNDGTLTVTRIANFAKSVGIRVDVIWHSGKLRAIQTAEALARTLNPAKGVRQVDGLNPMDSVNIISEKLTQQEDKLLLVGHLPHLSKLASYLLCGEERPLIQFQMAGIVHLTRSENPQWLLASMITPDMLSE